MYLNLDTLNISPYPNHSLAPNCNGSAHIQITFWRQQKSRLFFFWQQRWLQIYREKKEKVKESYLIVNLKRVSVPFGPEVLRVSVQGEVDLLVKAFDQHRVPVLVIEQTAQCDHHTAAAWPDPGIIWHRDTRW